MGISPNKIALIRQVWRTQKAPSPAVFFDRDGTLIRLIHEVRSEEQVTLFRAAGPALRALQDKGFLLIVVTNQPIVEKGIITTAQAKKVNERLRALCKKEGVLLNAAYTCPHRFGTICACRKPGIGLIKQAQKYFSIDMKQSFLVGDSTRDMETGRKAKLKTILVTTGDAGKDTRFFKTKGNYTAKDLRGVASVILQPKKKF